MLRLRFSWLILIAALAMGSMATPVRAADATALLGEAHKMMQNGAYVKAIEIITATLASNKIPDELAGRALLMRAQSHEKLGKTAFALADYNQALFMEGLSAADKKTAEEGRNRVQGGLGVSEADSGEETPVAAVAPAAPVAKPAPAPAAAPKPAPVAKAPAAPARTAQAQPAPRPQQQQQEESGISSFFSGLFGGSQKEEKPQQAVVAVVNQDQHQAATKPAAPKPVKAVASGATQPPQPVRVAKNVEQAPRAAAPASSSANGEFAIQFAALLSEELAIAEVNRIAKKFGTDLGGRSPSVVIVPTKDGGTLYKIVAGPYPKAEGVATCEVLKSKNVSCMIITHKQQ